ncbi:hypothetical protein BCR34DRAFT_601685 [Clohesyomyces aquaticus]|uniref:Uncharacterized protein n=1 Tax=Clohesyomyces aquaticus TaxID=1231657 RepID=A0A1Y1ZL47_9PLEO|nr:hypothetical protein BCR34DRAFT_601685 [Clohesyomyces aquaticus]
MLQFSVVTAQIGQILTILFNIAYDFMDLVTRKDRQVDDLNEAAQANWQHFNAFEYFDHSKINGVLRTIDTLPNSNRQDAFILRDETMKLNSLRQQADAQEVQISFQKFHSTWKTICEFLNQYDETYFLFPLKDFSKYIDNAFKYAGDMRYRMDNDQPRISERELYRFDGFQKQVGAVSGCDTGLEDPERFKYKVRKIWETIHFRD